MSPTTDRIPASSTTTGRRTALQAMAALGLGWLGATRAPEAGVARKKKHKHRKKRRHQGGKTSTPPTPPAPAPADPGTPDPGTCPPGKFGVEGRCAVSCDTGCPGGSCLFDVEDQGFCATILVSCDAVPQVCSSNVECGVQELCAQTICGDPTAPPEHRCVPLLP